jgi:hypothetical protein
MKTFVPGLRSALVAWYIGDNRCIGRNKDFLFPVLALKGGADALYVVGDLLVSTNRARIHTLAMSARLPAVYNAKEHVEAGCSRPRCSSWLACRSLVH